MVHQHKISKTTPEPNNRRTVQSVERTLDIIEALAEHDTPVSLSELAQTVNLNPSTVHRLLGTLMVRGFVDQDEHSHYKLSLKIYYIGNAATYSMDIRKIAAPFMQELWNMCNETVNLAVLDQGEVTYIDQLESNNIVIVKMFARVGSRGPAYCTGSGKVLLSGLTEDIFARYLNQTKLQKFTGDTITERVMLAKEIERVRKDGYALDLGERDEGVRCVAAPIKDQYNRIIAALSVSGPNMRMTASYVNNELVPLVKEMAGRISRQLGCP
ncbi:MAG TPA: IclR family transcriptional regulator [Syntrophomonadaceae bacterium]|nr:IclR family transcriptional regulator [Syntrophomonadaceae bacterium]